MVNYRSEVENWVNVIDGDFISQFVELTNQIQLEISKAAGISEVDKVIHLIDSINSRIK